MIGTLSSLKFLADSGRTAVQKNGLIIRSLFMRYAIVLVSLVLVGAGVAHSAPAEEITVTVVSGGKPATDTTLTVVSYYYELG